MSLLVCNHTCTQLSLASQILSTAAKRWKEFERNPLPSLPLSNIHPKWQKAFCVMKISVWPLNDFTSVCIFFAISAFERINLCESLLVCVCVCTYVCMCACVCLLWMLSATSSHNGWQSKLWHLIYCATSCCPESKPNPLPLTFRASGRAWVQMYVWEFSVCVCLCVNNGNEFKFIPVAKSFCLCILNSSFYDFATAICRCEMPGLTLAAADTVVFPVAVVVGVVVVAIGTAKTWLFSYTHSPRSHVESKIERQFSKVVPSECPLELSVCFGCLWKLLI